MSLALAILHAILLFGWGLLLNDSLAGYVYCRLTMPSLRHTGSWWFSVVGLAVVVCSALVDRYRFRLSLRMCIYPACIFVLTQTIALCLIEGNVRFPEITW